MQLLTIDKILPQEYYQTINNILYAFLYGFYSKYTFDLHLRLISSTYIFDLYLRPTSSPIDLSV